MPDIIPQKIQAFNKSKNRKIVKAMYAKNNKRNGRFLHSLSENYGQFDRMFLVAFCYDSPKKMRLFCLNFIKFGQKIVGKRAVIGGFKRVIFRKKSFEVSYLEIF